MRTGAALGLALALVGAGMLAGLTIGRSCSPAAPAVTFDTEALAAIETERAQRAADTERAKVAITEEAQRRRGLELHERIAVLVEDSDLVGPTVIASQVKKRAKPAESLKVTPIASVGPKTVESSPCSPLGDGWARCQEAALDRLTLRLVDAEQDRDVARIELDAERVYRRLDGEAAAVREEGLLRELDRARPAPWKPPALITAGAAVATGIALAATGHEEVGAAVGLGGAVLGAVVVW